MAVRPIDGNILRKWCEKIIDQACHPATVQIGEVFLDKVRSMPTLTPTNEPLTLGFDVVDKKTGKYPDWERIAREEDWAKGLVYCDMDGVAIREDGSLILLDECGNCVSCPPDRFEIRRPPEGEEDT